MAWTRWGNWFGQQRRYIPAAARLASNPIIAPAMLPVGDGDNINGPSLVRAPDWLPRLGEYYLYFAHHNGQYIRLAYADRLSGPWTIYAPGTLHLAEAPMCRHHIASPDVHIDDDRRELRMYFHGPIVDGSEQQTFIARSDDGIAFRAEPLPIASSYLRVLPIEHYWIGMAMDGHLYRSPDGLHNWERSPHTIFDARHGGAGTLLRHLALRRRGPTLDIFYTMRGTAPESIWRCRLEMTDHWTKWRLHEHQLVLCPETEWEGAALPLRKSSRGAAKARENAVRDPAIFEEDDATYLLYAVAGESGIAIARLL